MRLLAFFLLAIAPTSTWACPPPAPQPPKEDGEDEDRYLARMEQRDRDAVLRFNGEMTLRQALLWDFSSRIFVARVERVKQVRLMFGRTGQAVKLKPVRWIKGSGGDAAFWFTYKGDSDCGPYGGGDAPWGKKGQYFVLFARPGKPSALTVEDSIGVANARANTMQRNKPRIDLCLTSPRGRGEL